MGFTLPFFNQAKKSLSSLQGKYIIYAIVICSLIGFIIQWPIGAILKNHEMSLKGRELNQIEVQTIKEHTTLIAIGVIILLLIVFILSMNWITKIIEKRRTPNAEEKEHQNFHT